MFSSQHIHLQLQTMQPALFRFAFLQLRNKEQAEDAVQEALLAILEKPDRFAGRSSFRTYVTSILKFKIIDILRLSEKEKQLPYDDDISDGDIIDSLFTANGNAINIAQAWSEPDTLVEQKDFFRVLEICLKKLPAKTARAFIMHECLDCETDEICQELNLSTSHFWVLLFRARLSLRESLDLHWFCHRA
jgi:RNA polymerase sigma-70 factor (ECF subfamily)